MTGRRRTAQCPLCAYATTSLVEFEDHVACVHSTTSQSLWNSINGGQATCGCGCGASTKWKGWHKGYSSMLNGHWRNGLDKHTDPRIENISKACKRTYQNGRKVWSEDLTKHTDPRLKASGEKISQTLKQGYRNGDYSVWSDGLTNETDERVRKKSAATAATLRRMHEEGNIRPWSKDMTKENEPRLMNTSATLTRSYATGDRVAWQLGLTQDTDERVAAYAARLRLPVDVAKRRVEELGSYLLVSDLSNYRNVKDIVEVVCTSCGETSSGTMSSYVHGHAQPPCPSCFPQGCSQGERELSDFVTNVLNLGIVRNERQAIHPKELDVYIPSKKFAVEYNGLYWHSELVATNPNVHHNKWKLCSRKGIRLLHVFEDEWRDKRPIVESMLRAKLDVDIRRIDARKCRIEHIDTTTRRTFFATNHIDGDVSSKFTLGLYLDDELVQCMSMRTPRHKTNKDTGLLEVARTCSKLNTYVRGGLSRLSKHAREEAKTRGYTGLMTYVDLRLGGDIAYQSAGWQFNRHTNKARMWWTDTSHRYDRFRFKRDAECNVPQADVAAAHGLVKIFGCRNALYTMK